MSSDIVGVLLAAGTSQRAGVNNKLFYLKNKTSLLVHSATALHKSGLETLLAVSGADHKAICHQLQPLGFDIINNPDFANGMGSSLSCALANLTSAGGVMVCLADMPHIKPSTFAALIKRWQASNGQQFIVPTFEGRRGNPVIIPACYFSRLMPANTDIGARVLMAECPESVDYCAVDDAAILTDYDTREQLLRAGWLDAESRL